MIGMLYLYEFLYSNEAKITIGRGRCIVRMVRAWTWCDQICGRYSTDFNKWTFCDIILLPGNECKKWFNACHEELKAF